MRLEDDSPRENAEPEIRADNELSLPAELIAAIPEDRREEFYRRFGDIFLEVRREEHYVGPLQPAAEAERWEALVPGTAARNFDLYEKQQLQRIEAQAQMLSISERLVDHGIQTESKEQDDNFKLAKTELKNTADRVSKGQWLAFIAFIFISLGGFYMVYLGHDALGVAVLVFEAVGVAAVFYGQFRRDQRRQILPSTEQPTSHSD